MGLALLFRPVISTAQTENASGPDLLSVATLLSGSSENVGKVCFVNELKVLEELEEEERREEMSSGDPGVVCTAPRSSQAV